MEVTIIDPKEFGIEQKQAESIVSKLNQIVFERIELFEEYERVVELDVESTPSEIFKKVRLSISNNRTRQLEPARKADKELFLRGGQFVDASYSREITENQRRENVLLGKEKHKENLEKQKAKDLNDARIERIRLFVDDVTGLDFAPMSDEDFEDYLLGKKTRFENAQKEAEAEAFRIEAERLAEIERQKEIEAENAKLKVEADKKDAEIAKLKEIERDKIEIERLAKIEAEKLSKAPIKKQLDVWVNSFELPECTVYNATSKEITEKFESFKKWSINQINNL